MTEENKTHSLYEGSVEISMDRRHIYRASIDGGKKVHVPNVTTILGMKDKSRALLFWQQRCIKEAFEQRFPVGKAFKFDEIQRNKAIDIITGAADAERKQAADIGMIVHKYIEARILGSLASLPENTEARNACIAFNNWIGDNVIEPVFTERMCYSRKYNYCGTADLVAKINGKMTCLDFKSSKAIYNETCLQVSAYAEAFCEETGIDIEQRAALRCDKADASYEYLVFPDNHIRDHETFLSLLRLYHFDKQASKELRELAA